MWENYEEKQDDSYTTLLKRAKDNLPEHTKDDTRFQIPKVDSSVEGNRTFFRNFREVTQQLNRPQSHLLKFYTNELGTSGNIEGSRAIFQGKHARNQLIKLLERYVNDYVLCGECGKPDTRFIQQNRVDMMRCDACGATTGIRPLS